MTSEEILSYAIGTLIAFFIIGFGGKVFWNHYMSGRVKKGEYYMTTLACEQCRDKCCVNDIKAAFNTHMQNESWHDSEVNTKLENIETRMEEARKDNAEMRKDVGGIKSALDKMTSVMEIYVKRADERDRRTDQMQDGKA